MNKSEKNIFVGIASDVFRNLKYSKSLTNDTLSRWFENMMFYELEEIKKIFNYIEINFESSPPFAEILEIGRKLIRKTNAQSPEKKSSMCDMYLLDGSQCRKETNFSVGRYNVCEDCYEERREKTEWELEADKSTKIYMSIFDKIKHDTGKDGFQIREEYYFGRRQEDWGKLKSDVKADALTIFDSVMEKIKRKRERLVTSTLEQLRAADEEIAKHYNKINEENVKNKQVDVKHEVYAKTEAENLGVPEVCPEDFSAFFGGTYDEKISIFDDDVKFYEEYAELMANEG